jgi:hypothetical protein
MRIVGTVAACSVLLAAFVFCPALQAQEKAEAASHGLVRPGDLKWSPIMKGCELAPVSGNSEAEGPFVVRIRCGAGVIIPAHWHPTDENVTVLSGMFLVGMGDKYDAAKLSVLPPGGFGTVPKEMRHFALSKTATVVQVHGVGPFKVNWVNPSDVQPPDAKPAPKKAKPAAKPTT